jgi:hypothetical protein
MNEDREIIEVETDQLNWAKAPDIIEASGMGPCIGIILYEIRQKMAVVGHFNSPTYGNRINDLWRESQRLKFNLPDYRAFVGGGLISEPEDLEIMTEERNYVRDRLLQLGLTPAQCDIRYQHYLPPGESYLDLRIYTESGKVQWRTYQGSKLKNKIVTVAK